MKRELLKSVAVLIGAVLHHVLFWQTGFGVNTILFAVLIISMVFSFYPELSRSHSVIALMGGTVLAAVAVVLSHTEWSEVMYVLSFTLLIGVIQQRELRFLWYIFWLGAVSWAVVPFRRIQEWAIAGRYGGQWRTLLRWTKLLLIPITIFGVFLIVYSQASTQLANILERIGQSFEWLLDWQWSPASTLFFLFGLGLLMSLLFPDTFGGFFARSEQKYKPVLRRRRPDRQRARFRNFSMLALRNEYWIAVLVIGMLNGLLLLVNLIDFRYVWWPPSDPSPQELSQFVHKGTSMLILAILMAMGVLLVFFRRNLNFLVGNDLLKKLSYLWIAQNGLLALSVAVRNIHYIHHYGLTHKRLGVLLFLLLVVFGLITLYAKIRYPKTVYYLLVLNAWFVYAAFLGFALINWDIYMTRYNLEHPPVSGIDEHYLHRLSIDNTFLLLDYQNEFPELKASGNLYYYTLEDRKNRLQMKLNEQKWLEWNWPDERNRRYLRMREDRSQK